MKVLPPRFLFRHCPRCAETLPPGDALPIRCNACDLVYYLNPAVAVAVFAARPDGRVLFLRRSREPAMGRWAPPGGFIDMGETAEQAAVREVREEVALAIDSLAFIGSWPNRYPFKEVEYPVLDLFFSARAPRPEEATAVEEAEELAWLDPRDVDPDSMAFSSTASALRRLQGVG